MPTVPRDLNLDVINTAVPRVSAKPLWTILRTARRILHLPPKTEVQVALVTDRRMRELNRRIRHVDRPTDVLSFPLHTWEVRRSAVRVLPKNQGSHRIADRHPKRIRMRESEGVPRDPDGVLRLGSIVISVETARRQARALGTPLADELSFLFAHGLLHVAGHDHKEKTDARVMDRLTERLIGPRDGEGKRRA